MDLKDLTQKIFDTATPKLLKDWIRNLASKVESLTCELDDANNKIKSLENKIRKLEGLPLAPKFDSKDKTSELDKDSDDDDDDKKSQMRKKRKEAAKKDRSKKKDLHIDKKEKVPVDPELLDDSFIFKGTRKIIIQDVNFSSNNIEFELERYWSPVFGTLESEVPDQYKDGFFGPNLKALILSFYYDGNIPIKKIKRILKAIKIRISVRQINRIINKINEVMDQEFDEAREVGIEKARYQQIDDTGAKVCFKNAFTTVTCNPYFTNLFTSFTKNRSNAVLALAGGKKKPLYKLNGHAVMTAYLANKALSFQIKLERLESNRIYTDDDIEDFLNCDELIDLKTHVKELIKTSMLVGAFYDGELGYVGDVLISDDAGQFSQLYDTHTLCWPHELRHYKKLEPVFFEHKNELNRFKVEVKSFYRELKKWITTRKDDVRDYLS